MKFKERMKEVAKTMEKIEKQFGQGAIMALGSAPSAENIPAVSSGSFGLDLALGTGGYPKGRICEVFGPESSGKTTLTLHAIAQCQQQGGICAFLDAEHALDVTYAKKLGVDADALLVSQPDYGEQALEIADMLIRSGGVDLIVVDSVAALTPKAELEGEMGDHHVGLQARMMSQAMRKLTGVCHKHGATILFINQTRQKIGVSFGSPETTTGGNALKFYASVRLNVRRIGKLKDADNIIGDRVKVKVVKNKMAPPFREALFDIRFGEGISQQAEIVDLATELNVIQKSGAWFSFDGEKLAHGREKAIVALKENPELFARVVDQTLTARKKGKEEEGKAKSSKADKAA